MLHCSTVVFYTGPNYHKIQELHDTLFKSRVLHMSELIEKYGIARCIVQKSCSMHVRIHRKVTNCLIHCSKVLFDTDPNQQKSHKLLHTFIRNRPMLYTRHTQAYFWPLQHSLAIMPFDRFFSKIKIRHFSCNISSLYILESSDRNGKFFAHYFTFA